MRPFELLDQPEPEHIDVLLGQHLVPEPVDLCRTFGELRLCMDGAARFGTVSLAQNILSARARTTNNAGQRNRSQSKGPRVLETRGRVAHLPAGDLLLVPSFGRLARRLLGLERDHERRLLLAANKKSWHESSAEPNTEYQAGYWEYY